MTVIELLQSAKEKINTPEKWCKDTNARDAEGFPVHHSNARACRWCASAAILEVAGESWIEAITALSKTLKDTGSIPDFNDRESTTHADVMAAFDRAIALAKQEAAFDRAIALAKQEAA